MDSRRPARAKVKTGCRTCKIRKVKCDEGRPACHRCVSTGRTCDGYGIWGGGNHGFQHLSRDRTVARPLSLFLVSGTKEKGYFEWFKCRTTSKLQGSFQSCFWDTLLLQASHSEPAVLHGVLALSSVHRRGTFHPKHGDGNADVPDEEEKFTLEQYVKAIGHLQPHFASKNRTSSRIALTACLLFISLDLLRGHFATAQVHLKNGLDILQEMQLLSHRDGVFYVSACGQSIDDWIIEAFSRLQLQVELFNYSHQHACVILLAPQSCTREFRTMNDAWNVLQRSFNDIFRLTQQARQRLQDGLLEEQERIQVELERWLDLFNTFYKRPRPWTLYEVKCYLLLSVYHTMANVMLETCLSLNDESVYDSHTPQFVTMMELLDSLWCSEPILSPVSSGHPVDMAKSVIDIGWIPALYYTAIKCRVHRIRHHAIDLLERVSHREGFWDSKSTACVARKVVEVEEGSLFHDKDGCHECVVEDDTEILALPESRRLREVEVVLSGAPLDTISVFCKQLGTDNRVLLSECNVHARQWKDGNSLAGQGMTCIGFVP